MERKKRFNRTFMELKSTAEYYDFDRGGLNGFNRTFMELKCVVVILRSLRTFVLIVPLWN